MPGWLRPWLERAKRRWYLYGPGAVVGGYLLYVFVRGKLSAMGFDETTPVATSDAPHCLYAIDSGTLQTSGGTVLATGCYAGNGIFLNDPGSVTVIGHGPIPPGVYTMGPAVNKPQSVGANAYPLEPSDGNSMFGRSGFYMHGDNGKGDQSASDGCIIAPPTARAAAFAFSTTLIVVNSLTAAAVAPAQNSTGDDNA